MRSLARGASLEDDPAGGNGPRPDGCNFVSQFECLTWQSRLDALGIRLQNLFDWTAAMLEGIFSGVTAFVAFVGGGSRFLQLMNGIVTLVFGGPHGNDRGFYSGNTITLYNAAFTGDERNIQTAIVHELAHHWDAHSGPEGSRHSDTMRAYLASGPGDDGRLPSDYAVKNWGNPEDFAESVTATILGAAPPYQAGPPDGNFPGNPGYAGSRRDTFVRSLLCANGEWC